MAKDAAIGIIHFGTSCAAVKESIDQLSAKGQKVNDLRVLAFPFHDDVLDFIESHKRIFIVEQNRDAQFKTLLVNELEIDPKRLESILHFNGDPISARLITEVISQKLVSNSSANVA